MKRRTVKLAHRDVKSGNVLLTTDDYYTKPPEKLLSNVLLCDFGVSHQVKTTMGSSTFSVKAGTPSYMAPELTDPDCTPSAINLFATDVFSFGILMWEVLSGQQPFGLSDPLKTAIAIMMGKRPTPEPTAVDLVQGGWTREQAEILAPLIKECWAQDPKDRPTMEAVSERLYPLLPKSHFL
jgi:serine/threonine protein kinase